MAVSGAEEETRYASPGGVVELSAEEGAVEAAFDGGALLPVPGELTAPAEEGGHWLALATRDAVGRTSEVRWVRLVVDGAPPAIELATEPPAAAVDGVLWTGGAARVVARASDEVSGVARVGLTCGGEPVVEVGGEAACSLADLAASPAAEAAITAWAEDVAGNRAETTTAWRLDAVPPRVALVIDGDSVAGAHGRVMAPSARLTTPAEDAGSGVAGFALLLDGGEVDDFEELSTGVHEAGVVAFDRAGNRSPAAALDFAYDAEPPVLEATLAWPGDGGDGVVLRLAVRDEPAGLASLHWSAPDGHWHALGASAVVAGGAPLEMTFDDAGARTAMRGEVRLPAEAAARGPLSLTALDRVGNEIRVELALPPAAGEGE